MGHSIKYENLELGNTTQQSLSTTRPCCSIEFIESFLFWVILIIYNIGIYICIYIYKVSRFHSFLVISNCNLCPALDAKHFEIWKNLLWNWWVDCFKARSIKYFQVFVVNPFSLLWSISFFSTKLCFFWSPCLLLISESFSLDAPGKPIVGFFFKINFLLIQLIDYWRADD